MAMDIVANIVGLENFRTLFGNTVWSTQFWNALGNNFWFFVVHMLVQNPIGIALAAILSHPKLRFASFYRSAIFIPTILSFVIVGFAWKLILSPIWGIAPGMLDAVGLKSLYAPWLGKEAYALTALSLVSVWQFVGIPMMLMGGNEYAGWFQLAGKGAGIQTFYGYGNGPHLAPELAKVGRENVFVSTGIPCGGIDSKDPPMNSSAATALIDNELAQLKTTYADLLLLHHSPLPHGS